MRSSKIDLEYPVVKLLTRYARLAVVPTELYEWFKNIDNIYYSSKNVNMPSDFIYYKLLNITDYKLLIPLIRKYITHHYEISKHYLPPYNNIHRQITIYYNNIDGIVDFINNNDASTLRSIFGHYYRSDETSIQSLVHWTLRYFYWYHIFGSNITLYDIVKEVNDNHIVFRDFVAAKNYAFSVTTLKTYDENVIIQKLNENDPEFIKAYLTQLSKVSKERAAARKERAKAKGMVPIAI